MSSSEQQVMSIENETTPSSSVEDAPPVLEFKEKSDEVQLEPTQDEMERERLSSRAEQLQDEIESLRAQLLEKETELAGIKEALGITAFTEFKQSISNSFKVVGDKIKEVQDTETYKKIDGTLTGWKSKVEESGSYQKTKSTLSAGGKKVQDTFSAAGTKIKENETLKSVGSKTSDAFSRAGTRIKETASTLKEKVWTSSDDSIPTEKEAVVPDEPTS